MFDLVLIRIILRTLNFVYQSREILNDCSRISLLLCWMRFLLEQYQKSCTKKRNFPLPSGVHKSITKRFCSLVVCFNCGLYTEEGKDFYIIFCFWQYQRSCTGKLNFHLTSRVQFASEWYNALHGDFGFKCAIWLFKTTAHPAYSLKKYSM